MKKRRRIKEAEGYFTVETALLLPFVIGTIIYIIYFQFFWYNRCLMDQEAAMTGIRAVQEGSKDQEELKQKLERWRGEFLTDKYVDWKAEEAVISCGRGRLTVRQKGSLEAWNSAWSAQVAYENKCIDLPGVLRSCRKIRLQTEEKK